jgi:membrane associated rhomboid family serine protease
MFPLKDNNPTSSFPLVTVLLIIANVAVYIYSDFLGMAGDLFYQKFAVIPVNVVSFGNATDQGPVQALGSLLTSQFLHGSLLHIVGNMLFLWIFGNNVEDRFGKILFIFFYLFCGVIAAWAQILGNPMSLVPMLGASGAVAGVMGAYLLMFPKAEVLTLLWIVIFIRLVWLPAYLIIILWIVVQVINQLVYNSQGGGVAYLAHIGGFAAGMVFYFVFKLFGGLKGQEN